MPVSGIVIRLSFGAPASTVTERASTLPGLTLGESSVVGLPGVIDADDYPRHDAVLDSLAEIEGVCAIDVVFHDFSDVTQFDRMPRQRRSSR